MNPNLKIGCMSALLTAGGWGVHLYAQQASQPVIMAVSIEKGTDVTDAVPSEETQPSEEESVPQNTEANAAATLISDSNLLSLPDVLTDLDTHSETSEGQAPDSNPWLKTQSYWQIQYHRQVTPKVFAILKYPYYRGGQSYAVETLETLAPHWDEVGDKNDESAAPATGAQNDPGAEAEAPPHGETPAITDIERHRYLMESIFEACHRWRQINASEGTTLEVVRTIELTRTTTRIYRIDAQLAVDAKRTIGQIGRLNRKFDLTSRLMIEAILTGEIATARVSRLDKQLTDLETLLARLAVQNDKLSVAMGMGKIERSRELPEYFDRFDYSAKRLPEPVSRLP